MPAGLPQLLDPLLYSSHVSSMGAVYHTDWLKHGHQAGDFQAYKFIYLHPKVLCKTLKDFTLEVFLAFQCYVFNALLNSCSTLQDLVTEEFPLLMPKVKPELAETYLCTPIRMDTDLTYSIVGFRPNATKMTAHHMLIYGCEEPGMPENKT